MILKTFGKESSPNLQRLNLSRNENLGDEPNGETSLGSVSHVDELDLSQCGLSGDWLANLLSFPKQSTTDKDNGVAKDDLPTWKKLHLQDNPLGTTGFNALLPLIRNSSLHALNISKCDLEDESITRVADSSAVSDGKPSLLSLDMSNNNISATGMSAVSEALQPLGVLSKLVDLNLSGNPIGGDGVTMLAKALEARLKLEGSTVLKTLDLSNTQCGIQAAIDIVSFGNLESLHLFKNTLGSDGFIALAAATLQGGHSSIQYLDLGGNGADQESVVTLLGALLQSAGDDKKNQLKVLVVGGNETGEDVEQMVTKVREVHPSLDIARDKKGKRQPT